MIVPKDDLAQPCDSKVRVRVRVSIFAAIKPEARPKRGIYQSKSSSMFRVQKMGLANLSRDGDGAGY